MAFVGRASAHIVPSQAVGFTAGIAHPFSGLDHMLAMICVGVWGAQLGQPAIWLLPVTFPMIMALGGFLGLIGVSLPGAEMGVALAALVLGTAVMLAWQPRLWMASAIVGAFGLYHGYAHGVELPPGGDALLYSAGFVAATGGLHLCGIALGLIHRWRWGRYVVRAAGTGIAVTSVTFLWNAVY
jgi:urease accessory protein